MPPWEVRKIIDPKVPKGRYAMLVPNKGNPSKGSQNFTHLPEVTACITSPCSPSQTPGGTPTKALLLRCSPASWDLDPSRGTEKKHDGPVEVVAGVVGRWGRVPKKQPKIQWVQTTNKDIIWWKKIKLCVSWLFCCWFCFLKWRNGVLWSLKMLAKCYNGSMKYQLDDYDLVGSWWHTLFHVVIFYKRIEKIQSKNRRSDGRALGKKFRQYYYPLVN